MAGYSFDHLDPERASLLGSICRGVFACPQFPDVPPGERVWDWTHANALDYSPRDDSLPWFSHAHDTNWLPGNRLVMFDNGNVRCVLEGDCMSRGQVYEIDEEAMVVRHLLNVDLGTYAFAVGSSQQMRNGNYAFGLGIVPNPSGSGGFTSQSSEFSSDGEPSFALAPNVPSYRLYRVRDLYSPPPSTAAESPVSAPEQVPADDAPEKHWPRRHGRWIRH
jgi:hypothetical protein